MKKIKKLYLIDPKIKWRVFKRLHDKLVHDSGPSPKNGDKILWQMCRDKQIYLYFCEEMPNDLGVTIKLPLHKEMVVITNPN